MFGNMGQMMQLLKDLPKMAGQMKEMQERLGAARFSGESGGGQVSAVVDGKGELVSLNIDPQLVTSGDKEMIEDLTIAAVREAVRLSREGAQKELQSLTNGVDLGGILGMLGGKRS